MADEPRRSGRATKGQHKHASSSPAPPPQPKPTKTAKTKPTKKSQEPEAEDEGEDEGEDEEEIRCICGNNNPKDKRAFIGCDACTVWQHNVCMGITDDEDDVPDHYFCEECRPDEHQETVQALAQGEKIWETRNKIYQAEKKQSKNKKGKATTIPGWLKKEVEVAAEENDEPEPAVEPEKEVRTKRKREEIKEEPAAEVEEEKSAPTTRQDKRRKSSAPAEAAVPDPESAIVEISKLPPDRQKIATALSKIITDVIGEQVKEGFRIPDKHTAKSLGDKYASLIEYELQMTHGGPSSPLYLGQFRALNANLKRNKVLVERILKGSLTPNEIATMESKDMASEELQKERAAMKEQLDRQAVAVQDEGPRYRRTHKGDELIEDENQHLSTAAVAAPQPVRERVGNADEEEDDSKSPSGNAGSPSRSEAQQMTVDTSRSASAHERRQSSQNFDMNNVWAKTAGSPTNASAPRPLQVPPRRRSSVNAAVHEQEGGTKHDVDIDRMLEDDDEPYSPADASDQDVVWRGKLVLTADNAEPTVNARFVAGRDMRDTVAWTTLLPDQLNIDGRLQINKAEAYLCSLEWSNSSDVSVLAFTPYDDAESFTSIFQYFKSRERYAVVNKDKPAMARDLYIIPVDVGDTLPQHLDLLEHCTLKSPAKERLLLATIVVARAPDTPPIATPQDGAVPSNVHPGGQAAANGQHLPQHVRGGGPAGSPMAPQGGAFSPSNNGPGTAYGGLPPNPYGATSPPQAGVMPGPVAGGYSNPLAAEVLGPLQFAESAQMILMAEPGIDRGKLENLKRILVNFPETQRDINVLASKLGQS